MNVELERPIRQQPERTRHFTASNGGLNRFEPESGKFVLYRHDPGDPQSLDADKVYSVYVDRLGTVWAGTSAAINRLDEKSGSFRHFSRDESAVDISRPSAPLYYFFEDRAGRFWFGGGGRRSILNRNTGASMLVGNTGDLSLYEDRNGKFWLASLTYLETMDSSGKLRRVPLSPPRANGTPEPVQVNFIHEDSAGLLWLATETGLVRLDPKTEDYTRYTTQEGLADNVIQCILPGEAGYLWVSTNNGISRFNPRENSFYNYHESDGLQGETFNRKACFQDSAGRMYFGGLHGFNVFDPRPVRTSAGTGKVLWDQPTAQEFHTVNGKTAHGGSMDAGGPAVVNGTVFVNSGYGQWGGMPGNVLLAFSAK